MTQNTTKSTLLEFLTNNTNIKFVSFVYTSKGDGKVARKTILINTSVEQMYEKDLVTVKALRETLTDETEIVACEKVIASLENSLKKGVGNNDSYTQKGLWKPLIDGNYSVMVRTDGEDGLQIRGREMQEKVFVEGAPKKPVKSSAVTIARSKIEKALMKSKFRSLCVSNVGKCRIDGETLIFD